MNQQQLKKLVKFLSESFDGHDISNEKALPDLAKEVGLEYAAEPVKKSSYRVRRAAFSVGGEVVGAVGLIHQKDFTKLIKKEGRGGGVPPGDWWGFAALSLVESFTACLAGYHSPKLGRGSRFDDCLEALVKLIQEPSEVNGSKEKING